MDEKLLVEAILATSILLQLVGASFSIVLIRKAEFSKWPWITLTGVFGLMAFRRSLSLANHLQTANPYTGNFEAEIVALIISIFLCVSMFMIKRAFGKVKDTMAFFHQRKLELKDLAANLEQEVYIGKKELEETPEASESMLRSRISILETRNKLSEITSKLEGLV